ncbi:MAG: hypothetical protein JRN23_06625 [Nitrososphaerota archaeon]|nr:hypothetical protein [Nitrososphaerota archaeon]MDG6967743.1 hypothetical protein [Nitrososphaerota archaeon]MDG6977885.1 hypothetical protein [Nitrososphaerota archaeon]MDG7021589.1 hypothetical protein [Nitrososphaerota archaeon]
MPPKPESRETPPRELVTVLYRPGKRLFQLAFRASPMETPLAKLLGALKAHQIEILSCHLSNFERTGGRWNVFLECDDYSVTAEGLRRLLSRLDFLLDLRVAGGGELLVDELHFPIVDTTKDRMMLFSKDSLQRMIAAMGETFGSGGTLISYQEGFAAGSRATGVFRAIAKGDLRHFVPGAVKLYNASGVGRADVLEADFDSLRFQVRIFDNIECEGKQTEKPNSEWIRGHLCGTATTALQVQMQCAETKCIASGDPFCLFVLSKQDA